LTLRIVGAGPAGCAAAIAALREGAAVRLFEQASFPRHKVCGEFLSPELRPILEDLGVAVGGARLNRVRLHFGRTRKVWRLDEPALGLSRYALDDALLRRAVAAGAELRRERAARGDILAGGRCAGSPARPRLFGFKAHFAGPADDALDLFFGRGFYAGVCAVERGRVNVCGLAPESLLRRHGFDPDSLVRDWTKGLARTMDWLFTGPLPVGSRTSGSAAYRAGDASGFIDPFTGSGILAAVWTGMAAGRAAALGFSPRLHEAACRSALLKQYRVAWIFRELLSAGVAGWLAPLAPGNWLFSLTRPKIA
jgi:flavin-dependent dehydrogenase